MSGCTEPVPLLHLNSVLRWHFVSVPLLIVEHTNCIVGMKWLPRTDEVMLWNKFLFCQVYSSLDLSRGHLEEKGETEGKKSESPLTLDSLSWTPDFAEMCVFFI